MVYAQEYIINNFPKHVTEISAIGKDLEGDLDLSEYPNLNKVDIGINRQLRSLRLARSNKITWISIYDTGINKFSFLDNMPNFRNICLPCGGGTGIGSYFDQRIQELQSQLNQEQAN